MNSKTLLRLSAWKAQFAGALVLAFAGSLLFSQAAPGRFVGTITAINGDTLTVKPDSGDERQVEVPSTAVLKRVEPGQKDLSAAATIQLTDLTTGDRVLVRLDANATGDTPQAAQIVTIKAADVAQKQQQERDAWARSGVGGLVKSVDPTAGVIVVTSGSGAALKIIKVHVNTTTVLKRYAPASVRFDLAQPGPIGAIQVGDQLRARGTKNADGTEVDAAEIVSGSFRNISGTIASLDASTSSFTVKDLLTKKQVTVRVTPDAQMHALPEMMARAVAARLKGTAPSAGGALAAGGAGTGQQRNWSGQGGGGGQWAGQNGGQGGGQGRGGDMQQMLSRTPVVHFSDLKKGDAVMVVATDGATNVTAITLLTGVEPLLEAPEASRNLLSNWSMGSGGGGEAEAQ
ncbi:MAG: hypothetical protein ACLP00_24610 [Terracidiphilus sp.]